MRPRIVPLASAPPHSPLFPVIHKSSALRYREHTVGKSRDYCLPQGSLHHPPIFHNAVLIIQEAWDSRPSPHQIDGTAPFHREARSPGNHGRILVTQPSSLKLAVHPVAIHRKSLVGPRGSLYITTWSAACPVCSRHMAQVLLQGNPGPGHKLQHYVNHYIRRR